jgi:hypothetical protein
MHSVLKEDEPVRIFSYWIASDQNLPVSTAQDLVAGLEWWPSDRRHARIEVYRKRYVNLADVNATADSRDSVHAFRRLDGESYGADVLLQLLRSGRYSGWVSYSYALSTRTDGTLGYAPAQDRRNEIDLVARYRAPSRWDLSAHFAFGSGTPYTDVVGQAVDRFYDPTTASWNPSVAPYSFEPVNGSYNGARYPMYQRLDVSASRMYHVRGATVTPSMTLINAYDYRNVFTYQFNFTTAPPTRTAFSQFPIFPAIGVTVGF